jgi:RNA polymerase sigma-70 factor, ECF subfamily
MSTITVPKRNAAPAIPDFERIFREHASLVYRTAYAVMGNREDADDILQTVFLRLLRRESAPDLGSNPKGYFYRAALNLSLDTIKIRQRQPQGTRDPEQVSAPLHTGDESFDDDMHRRLYEAIAQLSPEAAEILILRYVHNTSDAEIAKMLGVSRTVVAVRLFRTRARLKELIRNSLGDNS